MPAAEFSVIERHYSPSTREWFIYHRLDPVEPMTEWLRAHKDAIRMLADISDPEWHSKKVIDVMKPKR